MARTPVSLKNLLQPRSTPLGGLLQRVQQQRTLLKHVQSVLPAELRPHCLHAELHNSELLLFMDTSAWANRAQYLGPSLIAGLKAIDHRNVERLRIRVLPNQGVPSRGHRRSAFLSAQTADLIEAAANTIEDAPLRASLLRLAARHQRRNV